MRIGQKEFDTKNQVYMMGILNVTPDSFSDGGCYNKLSSALMHVQKMIREGVDLIDVGGESTRPGFIRLKEEEEIERVFPVIEAIKKEFDIPVSLDTYKSKVAAVGIAAGADLINDIWGLKEDPKLAEVIADSGLPCCLMHNRKKAEYTDFIPDVIQDLSESLMIAKNAGIAKEKIMIDPGIGFGKTYENNLEMIGKLQKLHQFELPVLLAASRKSVIGLTLDLPVDKRLEGTIATTVIGVMSGCSFIRVHDVEANKRAAAMALAIRNASGKEKEKEWIVSK